MESRKLHNFELWELGIQIISYIELVGALDKNIVEKAYLNTAIKHPILRTKVTSSHNDSATLLFEIAEIACDIYWIEDSEVAFNANENYQQRIVKLGRKKYDHTRSLSYWKLASIDETHHELYLVLNHSHADASGAFNVLNTLCENLEQILAQKEPLICLKRQSQSISSLDIIQTALSQPQPTKRDPIEEFPLESMFAPGTPFPIPDEPSTTENLTFDDVVYLNLHPNTAKYLQTQCRNNNATVQGAVSLCLGVAYTALQSQSSDDKFQLPQNIAFGVPVNLRALCQIPLNTCVCGSSAVHWSQYFESTKTLWSLASEATSKIRTQYLEKAAIEFWRGIEENHPKAAPMTVMGGSLGICPVKPDYGAHLEVKNVELVGCFPEAPYGEPQFGLNMNLITFGDTMKISVVYNRPKYPTSWAKKYASLIRVCLDKLADPSTEVGITVGELLKECNQIYN
ncbi:hypothetical protein K7432_015440 [Basidiobolus ranarum]|uniref:Alcohol acetyltransferase n=1 Tax=Basidiobolus ranarum TaxID=34480 RepID=A0ABR2VN25_9FUNG